MAEVGNQKEDFLVNGNRIVKLIDEDGKKVVLPIDNTGLDINKSIKYKDNTGEGNSSLTRIYEGYEPATISITFELADDEEKTALEKVKEIEKTFKRLKNGRPVVWTIIDAHCRVRGIKYVQYLNFSTTETEYGIQATVEFTETKLPERKKEKKTSKIKGKSNNKSKNKETNKKTCTEQSTSDYCRELLVKYEHERINGKTNIPFEEWAKNKPIPPSTDTA